MRGVVRQKKGYSRRNNNKVLRLQESGCPVRATTLTRKFAILEKLQSVVAVGARASPSRRRSRPLATSRRPPRSRASDPVGLCRPGVVFPRRTGTFFALAAPPVDETGISFGRLSLPSPATCGSSLGWVGRSVRDLWRFW